MNLNNDLSADQARLRATLAQARKAAYDRGTSVLDTVLDAMRIDIATLEMLSVDALGLSLFLQKHLVELKPDLNALSLSDAIDLKVFLTRSDDGYLLIADDPWNDKLLARFASHLGQLPQLGWARAPDIAWALHRAAEGVSAVTRASSPTGAAKVEALTSAAISLESIERTQNPVVRFVDSVIYDAWKSGASDIHIETVRTGIIVKYRLDGVLVESARFDDAQRVEEVLNRVKVLAQLDISERRIPQDGRFRSRLLDKDVDFRVSIMPSIFGEDAVIRLLDKSHFLKDKAAITLEALGLTSWAIDRVRLLAREPHGMLLVTGPTGSGKTTTLYAVISEIATGLEKFVTIEDPVEYELPGVLQIPVNEKKGLTFSRGLRSILRHDPDKILVGEIRDSETAEIAVQAALTGHGVYTTVHANNAFDVTGRFLHMGVDLHSFASALNGVVSQRLMRKVCDSCAEPTDLGVELAEQLQDDDRTMAGAVRHGKGCEACRYTGYRGRIAIAEVISIDDRLRQLMVDRAPQIEVKAEFAARKIKTLRQVALNAVWRGLTTEEELRRVVASA